MHDAWEAAKKALCNTFEQASTMAKELYEKEKELRQREEKFRKTEIKASFADSDYTQTKKEFARKEARLLGKEESVTEWQLPCFLREETTVVTSQSSSKQDPIDPPERLDSVWETLGQRLKEQAAQTAKVSTSSLENQKQAELSIAASLETTPVPLKETILLFLEDDYQRNSSMHQARWKAKHELENKIKEKDLAVAATQRNFQREPVRVSFPVVPSQSSYRRNLFDLMNARPRKASISEASETASVSDTSSQTSSTIDPEAYKEMTAAAIAVDTAQAKLDGLTWDAEKIRSGEDSLAPNEAFASEWEKADKEFQKHLKEQGERLQEIAFRAKEEKNWENNLKRWECINEIERKEEELKAVRKKVCELIKLQHPNWQQVDNKAQDCEKALKDNQEKWTLLANQEENICLLRNNGEDEATLKTAREELQKADRRINELGKKVRAQYQTRGLGEEVLQQFLDSLSLSEKEKSTVGIWIAQLKREERAAEERRAFAAERYFDGDPEAWEKLTLEERSKYNQPIRGANKARQEKEEKKLREAKEEAEKTKIRSDRYNGDSLSCKLQSALYPASKPLQLLKEAGDAANNLKEIKSKQAENKGLILWAKLSDQEREKELKLEHQEEKSRIVVINEQNIKTEHPQKSSLSRINDLSSWEVLSLLPYNEAVDEPYEQLNTENLPYEEVVDEPDEPPQLQSNFERIGRNFFAEAKRVALMLYISLDPLQEETLSLRKSPLVQLSFFPEDKLLSWSSQQVDNPSFADKERWACRRQLNLLHKKTKQIAYDMLQDIDDKKDSDSNYTLATRQKSIFSHISYTVTMGTALTINQPLDSLKEIFEQLIRQQHVIEEHWERLVQLAEQERQKREGTFFENNEIIFDVWNQADTLALKEQEYRQKAGQEETAVQKLRNSWPANIRRWKLRAEADRIALKLNFFREEFFRENHRAEHVRVRSLREEIENLKEVLKNNEETWRSFAMDHEMLRNVQEGEWSVEQQLKKLAEADRSVLYRWDQWQERYEPLDVERAVEATNGEATYDLKIRLHQAEEHFLTSVQEDLTFVEQEAKRYEQTICEIALQAASV